MNQDSITQKKQQSVTIQAQQIYLNVDRMLNEDKYADLLVFLTDLNQKSQPIQDHQLMGKVKTQIGEMFFNRLSKTNGTKSNSQNANTLATDFDTLLQCAIALLHSYSIQCDEVHYDVWVLSKVIQIGLSDDRRYTFMIYCAKAHQIVNQHPVIASKYLSTLTNLLPLCLHSANLLSDYVQMCRMYKQNFQIWKQNETQNRYNNILNVNNQECDNRSFDEQQMEYYYYHRFCGQSLSILMKKDYQSAKQILQASISILITTQINQLPHQSAPYHKLYHLITQYVIKMYSSKSNVPITLIPLLIQSHPFLHIASTNTIFPIIYTLAIQILPSSTTAGKVGSIAELLHPYIINKLIPILSQCLQGHSIVTQDIMEAYHRLSIYAGFVSPQKQTYLFNTIQSTLAMNSLSYVNKINVWIHCLNQPNTKNQSNYQIHCINSVRHILQHLHRNKAIISQQSHKYILCLIEETLNQTILTDYCKIINIQQFPTKQYCNVVGHLISFIENYLTSRRSFISEIGRKYWNSDETLLTMRQKIGELVQRLQDRMVFAEKSPSSQQHEKMQIQLVQFRIQQLNWD